MKRIGKLLGIVLMLLLGGLLVYLAFDPPEFLIFRQGSERGSEVDWSAHFLFWQGP